MSVIETNRVVRPVAPSRPEAPERGAERRPDLRVIEGKRARGRGTRRAVVFALALIAGMLGVRLALSLLLISGAYTEDELASQRVQAQRERTSAQEQIDAMASPQHLSKMATDLGMVPAAGVPSLDIEQRRIIGGSDAPANLPAVNPDLVPNAITSGDRDRVEQETQQKPQKAKNPGASTPQPEPAGVPSEFELSSPDTH